MRKLVLFPSLALVVAVGACEIAFPFDRSLIVADAGEDATLADTEMPPEDAPVFEPDASADSFPSVQDSGVPMPDGSDAEAHPRDSGDGDGAPEDAPDADARTSDGGDAGDSTSDARAD
jgi:hypothetical protein